MSIWDWLLIADGVFLVLVFVGGPILLSYQTGRCHSSGHPKGSPQDGS